MQSRLVCINTGKICEVSAGLVDSHSFMDILKSKMKMLLQC